MSSLDGPRGTLLAAVLVGTGHALLVAGLTSWFGIGWHFDQPGNYPIYAYTLGGMVLVGVTAAVTALRYRLVGPAVAAGTVLFSVVALTWPYVDELRAPGSEPIDVALFKYLLLWPVALGWVLLVGAVEYGVRTPAPN
ncbi:MAG: hypothetical protein ABEJ68_02365 [Halobacteriaceae archaeon]